jgi:hypothetical protein
MCPWMMGSDSSFFLISFFLMRRRWRRVNVGEFVTMTDEYDCSSVTRYW